MTETILRFPDYFLWGTATSSHQVEGGNHNNDWWAWEQRPGHIRDGSSSDPACDWWNRAEEDFDRAAAMGQNAHRLSLEWSRIEPREGQWSEETIGRYRQMLTALRERGIEPMVTLHHFTNPLWLVEKGGWEREETIPLFAGYVERVVQELGDLVSLWCTVNEPTVVPFMGYSLGGFPPGKRSTRLAFRVLGNLLKGHAAAYEVIHRLQPEAQVGVAHNIRPVDPAHPSSPLDCWAAAVRDRFGNRLVEWALTTGELRTFPLLRTQRVPELAASFDYWGVNYYNRDRVAFDLSRPGQFFGQAVPVQHAQPVPWWWGEIYPQGLYRVLKELAAYGKPILVTENGALDNTDSYRPHYLLTHLAAVHRAIAEGVPVKGYFHWSLVDNFEWAEGYSARFGLIHVDFDTQKRTVKRSGELYGEICQAGGINQEMVERYAPEAKGEVFAA
ncbi:MAG: glycoside hydrolase family 1 protein [Anaerolineae bacterium]